MKKLFIITWIISCSFLAPAVAGAAPSIVATADVLGLKLQALSSEDLDAVQEEFGYRVGVLVIGVTPGSPGAKAGIKLGDVLFTVGDQGVDSVKAVEKALAGKSGRIAMMAMRPGWDEEYAPVEFIVAIPARARPKEASKKTGTGSENQNSAGPAKIRAQLKALVQARDAGILTEDEYARKKAELEALLEKKAPKMSEAVIRKLEALEKALKAGILSPEEYARKKAELAGKPQETGTGAPTREKGKTYRHAIGFSFWYPVDWTVKEESEFLQLVPPNPGSTKEGPTELYFIFGESVAGEGIQRSSDPMVVDYLDEQVRSLSPQLRRTARGTPVNMVKGEGTLLEWKGKSPAGDTILARAFVSIINQYGVTLLGLGLEKPMGSRDQNLRKIFASFGFGEGRIDKALAGKWNLKSTRSLTNDSVWESDWSRAQLVSETKTRLTLQADGRWIREEDSQMIAGAGGLWIESNESKVDKGRWYAGDGKLYLIWEDNSWEDYRYRIEKLGRGRQLRLVSGTRGEIWEAE